MTPDHQDAFQRFLAQRRLAGAQISPRIESLLRKAWLSGALYESLRLAPRLLDDVGGREEHHKG